MGVLKLLVFARCCAAVLPSCPTGRTPPGGGGSPLAVSLWRDIEPALEEPSEMALVAEADLQDVAQRDILDAAIAHRTRNLPELRAVDVELENVDLPRRAPILRS